MNGALRERVDRLRMALGEAVLGQEAVLRQLLIAVLSGGHVLLEGVPGLAKTRLLRRLADCLSLRFRRIQMTPDLMPSDITGTVILAGGEGGEQGMRFLQGPIFTDLLLADEINRAPPKTQAALLEAMEERQVSVGGRAHPLGPHFRVVATQNPIEQEGTYPLPFAQSDRFLLKVLVGYPDASSEDAVARLGLSDLPPSEPVLSPEDLEAISREVEAVWCPAPVESFALDLARSTRPQDTLCPEPLRGTIAWGAGVRASQALARAARAAAWLDGRQYVHFRDVEEVAPPVLRHRMQMRSFAAAEGVDPDGAIAILLGEMRSRPLPWEPGAALRRMLPVLPSGDGVRR